MLYNTVITAVVYFLRSRKQLRNKSDVFSDGKIWNCLHAFIQSPFFLLPTSFYVHEFFKQRQEKEVSLLKQLPCLLSHFSLFPNIPFLENFPIRSLSCQPPEPIASHARVLWCYFTFPPLLEFNFSKGRTAAEAIPGSQSHTNKRKKKRGKKGEAPHWHSGLAMPSPHWGSVQALCDARAPAGAASVLTPRPIARGLGHPLGLTAIGILQWEHHTSPDLRINLHLLFLACLWRSIYTLLWQMI